MSCFAVNGILQNDEPTKAVRLELALGPRGTPPHTAQPPAQDSRAARPVGGRRDQADFDAGDLPAPR